MYNQYVLVIAQVQWIWPIYMPNGVCSKLRGHIGSHQNLWDNVRTANGIVSSSLETLEKTVIALQVCLYLEPDLDYESVLKGL